MFAPVTTSTDVIQITSNTGEITIATLDASSSVDLSVVYTISPNISTSYTGIDNVASINSSWVGAQTAIINGRRYTVRSFNVSSTPQAAAFFAAGLIPSGSAFYVNAVNDNTIKPNDVLFLLSRAPHSNADRIYDKCVDASNINHTSPEMFYAAGNVYVSSSVVKSTYPLILVV